MKSIFVLAVLVVAATAYPYAIIEDEDGEQYYAVPIAASREKR